MPDWRNNSDYTFTDSLTPEGWAWEFLRRNVRYRETYRGVEELEAAEVALFGSYDARHHIQSEHLFYYDLVRNTGETTSEWVARCISEGKSPRKLSPSVWFAEQWGIKGRMPDPFADYTDPPRFIETPKWPKFVSLEECSEYFINEQSDPNYPLILAGLNLSLSIKEQMRRLNDRITTIKRELECRGCFDALSVKHRKGVWMTYLRILDAYEAGATANEIGKALFHDTDVKARRDHVYDSRKKAIELRDSEYRTILPLVLKT